MKTASTMPTLPESGFMRVNEIIQLIPIGRSTWWSRVKSGEFPQPVKLGPRTTVWRVEDIRTLINRISGSGRSFSNNENVVGSGDQT